MTEGATNHEFFFKMQLIAQKDIKDYDTDKIRLLLSRRKELAQLALNKALDEEPRKTVLQDLEICNNQIKQFFNI